ncbi:MAG: hypothetical protein HKN43_10640 [Rhodothermales bacterium]|nr:hypothetical protein [Rhodothermales bacterium]
MRGMINGKWHTELDAVPVTSGDLANAFATPAARIGIDPERLARNPTSYRLYAALACPFAHRTLLARSLAGLEALPVQLMYPWLGGPDGWILRKPPMVDVVSGRNTFDRRDFPDARFLWEVYRASDPAYTGRVSVPLLWDLEAHAIASAESREIVDAIVATQALRRDKSTLLGSAGDPEHETLADWIGDHINVGVYRVGFSATQAEYNEAHDALHNSLDTLEGRVRATGFLTGALPSVADLMLFATAVRFDVAYHGAFLLLDMLWRNLPMLEAHRQRMLELPGVADSVAYEDYRVHYFDDAAFNVRHAGPDGHFIVPRTFGETIATGASHPIFQTEVRAAS